MSRESQDRNFQITALFQYTGLHENQMANLCLHAIFPMGTGHMFMDLGLALLGLGLVVILVPIALFASLSQRSLSPAGWEKRKGLWGQELCLQSPSILVPRSPRLREAKRPDLQFAGCVSPRTHYSLSLDRWITVPRAARLEVKAQVWKVYGKVFLEFKDMT